MKDEVLCIENKKKKYSHPMQHVCVREHHANFLTFNGPACVPLPHINVSKECQAASGTRIKRCAVKKFHFLINPSQAGGGWIRNRLKVASMNHMDVPFVCTEQYCILTHWQTSYNKAVSNDIMVDGVHLEGMSLILEGFYRVAT